MSATAAALIASGAIGTAGQLYANSRNLDYTKWKNNVDYAIAERNNATQINMANTAHQREVADLRAAGLNPILSSGGSGASTPQLRTPEMGTFQTDNPTESLSSSAREAARLYTDQVQAQVSNLQAQNDNLTAQNEAIRESARGQRIENDVAEQEAKSRIYDASVRENVSRRLAYSVSSIDPVSGVNIRIPNVDHQNDLYEAERAAARIGRYSDVEHGIRVGSDLLNSATGIKRAFSPNRGTTTNVYDGNGNVIRSTVTTPHRK